MRYARHIKGALQRTPLVAKFDATDQVRSESEPALQTFQVRNFHAVDEIFGGLPNSEHAALGGRHLVR